MFVDFSFEILKNTYYQKWRDWKYKKETNPITFIFKELFSEELYQELHEDYFYSICSNPNIIYLQDCLIKYITKNKDKIPFNLYKEIENCPYLGFDFYEKLEKKGIDINWQTITSKGIVPLETIKNQEKLNKNLSYVMLNPNLSEDFLNNIKHQIDLNRFSSDICRCENISLEWIKSNLKKIYMIPISKRRNLTENLIDKWIHLDWYWGMFSGLNFSMEFIIKHINKPWDWDALSLTRNETDIKNFPYLPWNKKLFLNNSLLSLKFKLQYNSNFKELLNDDVLYKKCCEIDIDFLRKNKDRVCFYTNSLFATEKEITENQDLPWQWSAISKNSNISLEFLEKNIEKISFIWLSSNPIITTEFIVKHKNQNWDWRSLTTNLFLFHHDLCDKKIKSDVLCRRKLFLQLKRNKYIDSIVNNYIGYN